MRSGLRVLYATADELLIDLVHASPLTKRRLFKPAIDADLLVLDDLFLARRIAPESADELQSILHRRYKLRRSNGALGPSIAPLLSYAFPRGRHTSRRLQKKGSKHCDLKESARWLGRR